MTRHDLLLECPVYEALENVECNNGLGDGDGVPRVSNRHQPQILDGFDVAGDLPVRAEDLNWQINDRRNYSDILVMYAGTSFGVV